MSKWVNNDGLAVKFGTTEAIHAEVGEWQTPGGARVFEATFDLNDVPAAPRPLSDTVKIPKGAIIEKVEVLPLGVADGASAVLDVGFMKLDYTEYDFDGLLDGITEAALDDAEGILTTFVKGTTATLGGASGVRVGGTAADSFTEPVMVSVETADSNLFTAGRLQIRIFYSMQFALTKDLMGP